MDELLLSNRIFGALSAKLEKFVQGLGLPNKQVSIMDSHMPCLQQLRTHKNTVRGYCPGRRLHYQV